MAALIFSSIVAGTALVALGLLVAWVRRSPFVGMALVFLSVVPLWEMPSPPAIIEVLGLSIYASDVINLVFLVVGLLEVTQLRANLGGWLIPWALFGMLIALSLIRGVAAFGPGTAVNEARSLLYFFFAMTWVLAVRPDRLRLHTFSLVLGWTLVLVALYHAVTYGLGGASSFVTVDYGGIQQTGRVLIAAQALTLLLCAGTVFLGPSGSGNPRRQFSALSSLVFIGVVVLAQHRSVWSAGLLGMGAVLIWSGRRQARQRAFVSLVGGAWLGLFAWSAGILGSEVFESVSNTGTYNWRTSSWQALISEAATAGPATVVGGEPFGSGYLRQLHTGTWTSVSPHNWYVSIFLRLGVIGLALLTAILFSALVKSRARPSFCTFVIVAVGAYGWAYSAEWLFVPWLGTAIVASLAGGRQASAGELPAKLASASDRATSAVGAARVPTR